MKRKVFSLLVLCLFAFLGLANAQTSGVVNATPDPIDLGYRPLGAWMRPFEVQLTTTGAAQAITAIEADKDFFVINAELPGTVSSTTPFDFTVDHGEAEAGVISGNLVAMVNDRAAYIFDIQAVAYSPIEADVTETAPTITLPFTATVGENIYDNYLLPGEVADGKDVIYKMEVENDILFSANVEGENGKVALYQEGFDGEPGPGADNNYEGLVIGGGGGGPFEATVGVKTTTSGYAPAYYLYNNAISYQYYHADELAAAGVVAGEITSVGFFSDDTYGHMLKNVTIWMTNTTVAEAATTSPLTNAWTCVYTGTQQEVVGLNEFLFTTPFEWDGTSNICVAFQMNNGNWGSTIYWDSYNPGFTATGHAHSDYTVYDLATTTYTLTTTTNRAVTLFKGESRDADQQTAGIENMTLVPGIYYVAASSTSDEFTVNINGDVIPVPEVAYNPYPADGDVDITTPATLTWTFGEYTTEYRVVMGTTYPPTEVVVDWTNELANAYNTGTLYNNKNYFWRVDERNSTGETIGEIWGFTTTLNIPEGLTAESEKIYEGDALNLSWTPVLDRSHRGYNVYQDGVKINNEVITGTEYTVNGLAYNMDGYTYNVTAVYDEGESNYSNDLIVYVSGNGAIAGHAYEVDGTTGIAGVEVTIYGLDEFLQESSYTFTTDANGYYFGAVKAGAYIGMAIKEGYQAVELEEVAEVEYDETTPNINFIMQEVLYPVTEVVAEEMSDSQVKVYWGNNLTVEIIESFETGDLSAFDWVNDATYPWAVVTTNPYDGAYCLKSTNEGIASSTSAIEVSVEIPEDGLMSFYGKASCENNYDKGYFYIDNTEKCTMTGAGNWQKKEYPITAGVHTFKWAYSKDSSVNSNDDCFYVDLIDFCHEAAPVEPGWVYYDNGENEDAIGTGGGQFSWGVMFPAGSYAGNAVTKVMAFDYMAMTGNVTIYNDGTTAPANAVGTTDVTFTGATDFVEFNFASPVVIDPTKNLWVIFYNASGATYPAAVCANTGDANGRWVSTDGIEWMDLAEAGLDYTFMIRAFVTNAKGDVQEITVNNPHTGGTLANAGIAMGNRAFDHYNIYRTLDGDEANAELITSMTDTVFFDNDWASLEPGVYKWGVSRVYEGNRGNRESITAGFEDGTLGDWTTIDADGDGNAWYALNVENIPGHDGSVGLATSASYLSSALHPDNYLVSPQIELGGTISFWACAQDASWAAEKFGVAVSTSGNTSASDFTTIQQWTMTAKAGGQPTDDTRSGNRVMGTWYQFTVDLSSYSGQGYVAIRHFDCTDMFRLNVDDIEITTGGNPEPPVPPTPPITGGNESEIVWSNVIEHNMYATTTVTVTTNSNDPVTGAVVTLENTSEPDLALTYNATLDETGTYTWEEFRRGTYNVTITLDGFTGVETTAAIVDDINNLSYVLNEIIADVDGLYVSATGWAMFGDMPAPIDPVDPDDPDEPGEGDVSFDFASGISGWTTIDADGDGLTWVHSSNSAAASGYDYTGLGHNGDNGFIYSQSFIDYDGSYDPNNFIISPAKYAIVNGSTLTFYADYANDSYPDHFGVAVSTAANPTASDFTMVWEGVAKAGKGNSSAIRHNNNRYENWRQHTVDLSAYAGQNVWIAFRHFNSYDQYEIWIDDVTLSSSKGERSIDHYNVKLDDVLEGTTTNPFFQHNVDGLVEGETYTTSVQAVYTTGESEWVSFDWVYSACDNYAGLQEDPTAEWDGDKVVLNWVLPEGGDTPDDPDDPGEGFSVDFADGIPSDWVTIDANGDGYTWFDLNTLSNYTDYY
nr:choice-of-anchor J domain-containing protein [Bacteroidales bacterium]